MKPFRPRTAAFARLLCATLMGSASAPGMADIGNPGSGDPCAQAAANETCQSGSAPTSPELTFEDEQKGVFITQIGNTNRTRVKQETNASHARIVQDGDDNAAALEQAGNGSHFARLEQNGDGNALDVVQNGTGQTVLALAQQGAANIALIRQRDDGTSYSAAAVMQEGSGNQLLLVQDGTGNEASLIQDGNDNAMTATQMGDSNLLEWKQIGDGLSDLQILQTGGSNIQITQSMPGG